MTTTIKKWDDLFQDPAIVGSSEYRALAELCADATDIPNIGGEVDPDRPLEPQQVEHMRSVLQETIERANELLGVIAESTK